MQDVLVVSVGLSRNGSGRGVSAILQEHEGRVRFAFEDSFETIYRQTFSNGTVPYPTSGTDRE